MKIWVNPFQLMHLLRIHYAKSQVWERSLGQDHGQQGGIETSFDNQLGSLHIKVLKNISAMEAYIKNYPKYISKQIERR